MTISFNKRKDELIFIPLGGANEIGMNLNLYHLDGKWLIADFGAGFAEDYFPGVDMTVPDISFLQQHKKDIVGLVLTHAHEDHLGAIPYIWNEFDCPVYATPFTAAFLKAKLGDSNTAKHIKIIEVPEGSRFKAGPFDVELVQITHSAPEMNGVFLRTKHGNVFHSGDWKFDPRPTVGPVSDKEKLKKFGDEGVLAMVSDSTNVFSEGHSQSEGDLKESLTGLVASCKKMVIVTTFASNIGRIESIAEAARRNDRKVILAGRSLWRIVRAAQDTGYLQDCPQFHEDDIINKHPREKLLVISTGCQGEPLAATSKIASGNHRAVVAKPGDSIIFSSKIIPGNEKRIFRLFNQFVARNVEVLTEKDHFVHVSGHPNVDEVKEMYELVRPQVAIPVHGEQIHLHEHVRLAKSWGVPEALQIQNGVAVKLAPGGVEKIGQVEVGELGINGNLLLTADSHIIKTRRKIQSEGVIVATIILNGQKLATKPVISAPGALDPKEDADIIEDIQDEIKHVIMESFNTAKKQSADDRIDNLTRAAIRRIVKLEIGRNPPIDVNIVRLK